MSYKGMNSPISNSVKNPLRKGDKGKLKAHHAKNLQAIGIKPPKTPLT